jgi:hypothetical protein
MRIGAGDGMLKVLRRRGIDEWLWRAVGGCSGLLVGISVVASLVLVDFDCVS